MFVIHFMKHSAFLIQSKKFKTSSNPAQRIVCPLSIIQKYRVQKAKKKAKKRMKVKEHDVSNSLFLFDSKSFHMQRFSTIQKSMNVSSASHQNIFAPFAVQSNFVWPLVSFDMYQVYTYANLVCRCFPTNNYR